jgi:hypothetical protein
MTYFWIRPVRVAGELPEPWHLEVTAPEPRIKRPDRRRFSVCGSTFAGGVELERRQGRPPGDLVCPACDGEANRMARLDAMTQGRG